MKVWASKIWAFQYNDCYYESSYETMSLHKTKEGAEGAMDKHKRKHPNPYEWQLWRVEPMTVED